MIDTDSITCRFWFQNALTAAALVDKLAVYQPNLITSQFDKNNTPSKYLTCPYRVVFCLKGIIQKDFEKIATLGIQTATFAERLVIDSWEKIPDTKPPAVLGKIGHMSTFDTCVNCGIAYNGFINQTTCWTCIKIILFNHNTIT